MVNLKIFDSDILARDFVCVDRKDSVLPCNDPTLRLYVKLTDFCPSKCSFCANQLGCDNGNFDVDKFMYVFNYLYDNKLLHSISFTGGEPLLEVDKLFRIMDFIYNRNPNFDIQISTSGYNLKELASYDKINRLESIHISHHHYDEEVNRSIFNSNNIASGDDIMFLQDSLYDKKIININTLVMKGYIDSLEEIKKNLDYVGELGVYKNGFVSLMKCNSYAKDKFINFNNIFNNLDSNFFNGHHFYAKEYCECIDGIYLSSNNKFVEYYARMVKEMDCPYVTQLVYTSDNRLTKGFGKEEIKIK